MAFELTSNDLEALLQGGCFFGSGGGGTVISARHLASHFQKGLYYPVDRVRVVSVEEATEGHSVMVAYMGAPEAINQVQYPEGPVAAVRAVQSRLQEQGSQLAYVVAPESGALGFTVACLVAAKLGLAVIDADGAGRAVPSLPMLTYAAAHISPNPAFLVGQSGLSVELNVQMPSAEGHEQEDIATVVEQMLRPILANPQFGQFGGLAMWVMKPEQLSTALPIRGTLTRALIVGRALLQGEISTPTQLLHFLRQQFDLTGQIVFGPAVLVSAQTETNQGFDVGKINLQAGEQHCVVLYQNESLLAWDRRVSHPLVMAPDTISYWVEGDGQK
ncbi:MAG: DUF917 family protein, partial [Plesiomonas sp.]